MLLRTVPFQQAEVCGPYPPLPSRRLTMHLCPEMKVCPQAEVAPIALDAGPDAFPEAVGERDSVVPVCTPALFHFHTACGPSVG